MCWKSQNIRSSQENDFPLFRGYLFPGNDTTLPLFCQKTNNHASSETVWPEMAKFRHFSKSLVVNGKFLTVYFLFGQMLSLLWQTSDIIGQFFTVTNGQILKNNTIFWSHWIQKTHWQLFKRTHHYQSTRS